MVLRVAARFVDGTEKIISDNNSTKLINWLSRNPKVKDYKILPRRVDEQMKVEEDIGL